jgi:hypothetical protein
VFYFDSCLTCALFAQDAIEVCDPNTEQCTRYETFFPGRPAPYSKSACEKLEMPWISDSDEEIAEEDSDSACANLDPTLPAVSYIDNDAEYSDKVSYQSSGVADILITGEVRREPSSFSPANFRLH